MGVSEHRALAGCHVRAVARGLQAASHRVGVGLSRAPVATRSTWRWQRCSGGEQHRAPASASTIYAKERETHSIVSAHAYSNNPTGRAVGVESEALLVFALTGMDGAYKELGK